MIGEKLGPYEILESIGSGGMGEVWRARDTRLGRTVAIKKVKEQHSERFKQEARSIAALNHPNICQIHDIGPDYLVLEYVEGKPLPNPLPEQEAVKLAIQIATALEAAHKKGIIHRDLKPSNIMVTGEGGVKLLDFGLAKLHERDASVSSLPTEDMPATQAGAILGTVAYMSPEQAQGKPADARSDIFSFGLVLYEMLSGKRAFSGDSHFTLLEAIVRKDFPPLHTSPAIERILKRCLEKAPSDRYQRMSELKVDLAKAMAKKMTANSGEPQPSIAVLPFVNMSDDKEQEYFSDGLAEEIINALTKISGLKVIARTSAFAFKGKQIDIREIAEVLGVANILEGSVRKAGNRVRITAQLIMASDGSHLWSERYDRDLTDVFAVQDEIASAIARILEIKLAVKKIVQIYEPDLAAHEAYLKARHLWGKIRPEQMAQAQKYLEEAISLDPQYALAYCGLADHFLVVASAEYVPGHEAWFKIRQEAQNALEIDPSLPEANAMLGIVAAVYEFNWREAERRFRMAMAQDPIPARVRAWYGYFYLLPIGRLDESIELQDMALKEDPLNVLSQVAFAISLFGSGKEAAAQAEAEKILEFEENHPWALWIISLCYARQEKWEEALSAVEKASPMIPMVMGTQAGLLKSLGALDRAEEIVGQLMPGKKYYSPLGLFFYYHLCGDIDNTFHWLDKLFEQRQLSAGQIALMIFRSDHQRKAIARMLNLPKQTHQFHHTQKPK